MNKDEEGEALFITKIYSQENEYLFTRMDNKWTECITSLKKGDIGGDR